MKQTLLRSLEFLILYFGIPLFVYFDEDFIHPSILILPVLVFIYLVLRYTTDFRLRELIRWDIPRGLLIRHGVILVICFVLMIGYVAVFKPDQLFDLPRRHPLIFAGMCLFYPVISAYGQEIIYRTFLFRRYRRLFIRDRHFILASGIAFSFLHVVYYNPVSLVLTFIGGLYFAKVYTDTRSVLFTSLLHGVLGIMVFASGLGRYFWLDMPL